MNTHFDVHSDLIIIQVRLWGPTGDTFARFALDTGATETVVSATTLSHVGYDLRQSTDGVRVRTASGIEIVPRLTLERFAALGQERSGFPVLGLGLPADIDGLLGLDFVRGQELCINYRTGLIALG